MLAYVLEKQKTRKFILINILIFIIFMILYTMVDFMNMSYASMINQFGLYLMILNILLNLIMSLLSALMISFTTAQFTITKKEAKGSSLSFISIIFGMLTYGCTPCVIAFFAAIGISFSVIILPLANLPYKLFSLLLVILGFAWIIHQIKNSKCKID